MRDALSRLCRVADTSVHSAGPRQPNPFQGAALVQTRAGRLGLLGGAAEPPPRVLGCDRQRCSAAARRSSADHGMDPPLHGQNDPRDGGDDPWRSRWLGIAVPSRQATGHRWMADKGSPNLSPPASSHPPQILDPGGLGWRQTANWGRERVGASGGVEKPTLIAVVKPSGGWSRHHEAQEEQVFSLCVCVCVCVCLVTRLAANAHLTTAWPPGALYRVPCQSFSPSVDNGLQLIGCLWPRRIGII